MGLRACARPLAGRVWHAALLAHPPVPPTARRAGQRQRRFAAHRRFARCRLFGRVGAARRTDGQGACAAAATTVPAQHPRHSPHPRHSRSARHTSHVQCERARWRLQVLVLFDDKSDELCGAVFGEMDALDGLAQLPPTQRLPAAQAALAAGLTDCFSPVAQHVAAGYQLHSCTAIDAGPAPAPGTAVPRLR
eukprot:6466096-Prymnesium_polylepis.1